MHPEQNRHTPPARRFRRYLCRFLHPLRLPTIWPTPHSSNNISPPAHASTDESRRLSSSSFDLFPPPEPRPAPQPPSPLRPDEPCFSLCFRASGLRSRVYTLKITVFKLSEPRILSCSLTRRSRVDVQLRPVLRPTSRCTTRSRAVSMTAPQSGDALIVQLYPTPDPGPTPPDGSATWPPTRPSTPLSQKSSSSSPRPSPHSARPKLPRPPTWTRKLTIIDHFDKW